MREGLGGLRPLRAKDAAINSIYTHSHPNHLGFSIVWRCWAGAQGLRLRPKAGWLGLDLVTAPASDKQREPGTAPAGAAPPSLPPRSALLSRRNTQWPKGLQKQPVPYRGQARTQGEHTGGQRRRQQVQVEQPQPLSPAHPPPAQEEEQ